MHVQGTLKLREGGASLFCNSQPGCTMAATLQGALYQVLGRGRLLLPRSACL